MGKIPLYWVKGKGRALNPLKYNSTLKLPQNQLNYVMRRKGKRIDE
jgi:hypothetical protein